MENANQSSPPLPGFASVTIPVTIIPTTSVPTFHISMPLGISTSPPSLPPGLFMPNTDSFQPIFSPLSMREGLNFMMNPIRAGNVAIEQNREQNQQTSASQSIISTSAPVNTNIVTTPMTLPLLSLPPVSILPQLQFTENVSTDSTGILQNNPASINFGINTRFNQNATRGSNLPTIPEYFLSSDSPPNVSNPLLGYGTSGGSLFGSFRSGPSPNRTLFNLFTTSRELTLEGGQQVAGSEVTPSTTTGMPLFFGNPQFQIPNATTSSSSTFLPSFALASSVINSLPFGSNTTSSPPLFFASNLMSSATATSSSSGTTNLIGNWGASAPSASQGMIEFGSSYPNLFGTSSSSSSLSSIFDQRDLTFGGFRSTDDGDSGGGGLDSGNIIFGHQSSMAQSSLTATRPAETSPSTFFQNQANVATPLFGNTSQSTQNLFFSNVQTPSTTTITTTTTPSVSQPISIDPTQSISLNSFLRPHVTQAQDITSSTAQQFSSSSSNFFTISTSAPTNFKTPASTLSPNIFATPASSPSPNIFATPTSTLSPNIFATPTSTTATTSFSFDCTRTASSSIFGANIFGQFRTQPPAPSIPSFNMSQTPLSLSIPLVQTAPESTEMTQTISSFIPSSQVQATSQDDVVNQQNISATLPQESSGMPNMSASSSSSLQIPISAPVNQELIKILDEQVTIGGIITEVTSGIYTLYELWRNDLNFIRERDLIIARMNLFLKDFDAKHKAMVAKKKTIINEIRIKQAEKQKVWNELNEYRKKIDAQSSSQQHSYSYDGGFNALLRQLRSVSNDINEMMSNYSKFVKVLYDIHETTKFDDDISIAEITSLMNKISIFDHKIKTMSSKFS